MDTFVCNITFADHSYLEYKAFKESRTERVLELDLTIE